MFDLNFDNFNPRNLIVHKEKIVAKTCDVCCSLNSKINTILVLGFFSFGLLYFIFVASPLHFPVGSVVKIEEGSTTREIAKILKENNVIKFPILLELIIRVVRGDKGIMYGDYFFEERKNLFSVAYRMSSGRFGLTPQKITLFEGTSVSEMAELFAKKFKEFDPIEFKRIIKEQKLEGYLFPDTYLFLPNITAQDVVRAMKDNFDAKITEIQDKIDAFKDGEVDLHEIITMASIIEEEARTMQTMKMISGILWNRIEIGMPLQVDAVFPYIIGKNTFQVTLEDLKVDSPYNTYLYKGLPPGPITNPGIRAIIATVEPTESDYLYYLTGWDGNMYYARTYDVHKQNKSLYLSK